MSRDSLSRLSDRDLIHSLHKLVGDERARRVEILHHLNEVERRRLYAEAGYSSLFDYCVSRLRYSQSAAGRRIAAARALRNYPEIGAMLESGDANVVTVAMVAKLLTADNRDTLLGRIRGRSQDEVARVVAEYRPERARPDRVRPVCVRVPVAPAEEKRGTGWALMTPSGAVRGTPTGGSEEEQRKPAGGSGPGTPTGGSASVAGTTSSAPAGPPPTAIVCKHEIRFLAGDEFMKKLDEMKAILSNRMPGATLEQVFDAAMEVFLEATSPSRRARRRKSRSRSTKTAESKQHDACARPRARATTAVAHARSKPGKTAPARRHIPIAVRDAVFVRDGGRCRWVGPDGRRCNAARHLEVDHVEPYARGGTHAISNLRLLCREHNMLAAAKTYGRDAMAQYARRE